MRDSVKLYAWTSSPCSALAISPTSTAAQSAPTADLLPVVKRDRRVIRRKDRRQFGPDRRSGSQSGERYQQPGFHWPTFISDNAADRTPASMHYQSGTSR
jgi:hypothetical protein